jgi:hypothetical protein
MLVCLEACLRAPIRGRIGVLGLSAKRGSGKEAKLSYNGNLLTENRNGLIVTTEVFQANGTVERDAALVMLEQMPCESRITVGGDKGWLKTIALMRKVRHRGLEKVGWVFTFAAAAYNLVRMKNLLAKSAGAA